MLKAISLYCRRHWQGDFSQGQAFWVNLIPALAIFKTSAAFFTLFNIIENPVISTRLILPIAFVVLFLAIPWLFFGTIRATYIHLKLFKGEDISYFLFALISLAAALVIRDVHQSSPYLLNMVEIATEKDEFEFTIALNINDKNTANLDGQYSYGTTKVVGEFLKQNPQVTLLDLNIDSGHLHEARSIAQLIMSKKLDTQVSKTCAATCLITLVAGYNRTALKSANIKFHYDIGYDNGYRSDWLIERAKEADRQYYVQRGVEPSFSFPIYYKQNNYDYLNVSLMQLWNAGVINNIR